MIDESRTTLLQFTPADIIPSLGGQRHTQIGSRHNLELFPEMRCLEFKRGQSGAPWQEPSHLSIVKNLILSQESRKVDLLVSKSIHHRKRLDANAADKRLLFLFSFQSEDRHDLILGSDLVRARKAAAWCSGGPRLCSSLIWPWQRVWVCCNVYWQVYKTLCGLSRNFWRILSNPPFLLIKESQIALTWA